MSNHELNPKLRARVNHALVCHYVEYNYCNKMSYFIYILYILVSVDSILRFYDLYCFEKSQNES